jgi:hypothetical protein
MAMSRKTMIALLAVASIGLISPTMALARGGGGGHGGGGFHGGGLGGGFHGGGFHGGGFHGRGFGRGFGFGGFYGPYGYYDDYPYAYGDSYVDDGDCYVVQRRVHTNRGWRLRPVQVCG